MRFKPRALPNLEESKEELETYVFSKKIRFLKRDRK